MIYPLLLNSLQNSAAGQQTATGWPSFFLGQLLHSERFNYRVKRHTFPGDGRHFYYAFGITLARQ